MDKKKFLAALLIPVVILLAMTVTPMLALLYGEPVALETAPVDPIDLFRGQHVVLNYKISELKGLSNAAEVEKAFNKKAPVAVYGELQKQGEFYGVSKLSLTKPEGLYLKGKLEYSYEDPNGVRFYHVSYSLDKYFVPEGTGLDLEKAAQKGNLIAQVKLYKGYALLTGLKTR